MQSPVWATRFPSYQIRINYFKCYTSIKAILSLLTHNPIGNPYMHICSQVSNWDYHHKNSSSQSYLLRWFIWELVQRKFCFQVLSKYISTKINKKPFESCLMQLQHFLALKEFFPLHSLLTYRLKVYEGIFFILSLYTLCVSSLRRYSQKNVTEQNNYMPLCDFTLRPQETVHPHA